MAIFGTSRPKANSLRITYKAYMDICVVFAHTFLTTYLVSCLQFVYGVMLTNIFTLSSELRNDRSGTQQCLVRTPRVYGVCMAMGMHGPSGPARSAHADFANFNQQHCEKKTAMSDFKIA